MVKYRDYSNNKEFCYEFSKKFKAVRDGNFYAIHPDLKLTDSDFCDTVTYIAEKTYIPVFKATNGNLYAFNNNKMRKLSPTNVILFSIDIVRYETCIHIFIPDRFDEMPFAKIYNECTDLENPTSLYVSDKKSDEYNSKLKQIGTRDGFTVDKVLNVSINIPCIDITDFDFKTYLGEFIIVNNYKDKNGNVGRKLFRYRNLADTVKSLYDKSVISCDYVEAGHEFSEWLFGMI